MVLDHLKIQNVAFDAFVSERNNLDSHGFILLFMEMRCHTCPPYIYYTHLYKCDDPSLLHGGSKSRATSIIGFEADFCTIPSLQRAE